MLIMVDGDEGGMFNVWRIEIRDGGGWRMVFRDVGKSIVTFLRLQKFASVVCNSNLKFEKLQKVFSVLKVVETAEK